MPHVLAPFLLATLACQAPPSPPPAPVEPPASEAGPTTVAESLAELPVSPTHGQEQRVIEDLAGFCTRDCAPVLAVAVDSSAPEHHREAAWWGIRQAVFAPCLDAKVLPPCAPVPAEVGDAARRVLPDPATPDGLRRPAADVVLGTPDGRGVLEAALRESPNAEVRAAAACALLLVVPREDWKKYPGDAATRRAMGICATPWNYGQVDAVEPG